MLALLSFTGLVYAEDPDDQAPPSGTAAPAATAAPAPAPATPPAPPPKYDGFVFSGLLDGYITDNRNHPPGALDALQNFDIINGQPEMSMAKVTIDKSDSIIGFHVDFGTGETMRLIHAGDPAAIQHKALRYFEQMYLIAKPKNMHGTEIDFGTFVTSAGAEVIESPSNWNYSRSLLFAWAIPYYHFGLKTSTPLNKVVTIGFQLINPWNETSGSHEFTNLGFTLGVTKGIYTWNTNYYWGPNHQTIGTLPSGGKRNLFDTTLVIAPNDKTNFYINGDWARDGADVGSGHSSWEGIAAAGRYQLTKMGAVAARAEFFKDGQGASTGTAQNLGEFTLTGEYKIGPIFMARAEIRHDVSSAKFFAERGVPGGVSGMTTATLGLTAVFGPYK
jgi:hypothetical protein